MAMKTGFRRKDGISWESEKLNASLGGPCSVELVYIC